MLTVSFPLRSKAVWIPLSIHIKDLGEKRDTIGTHLNADYLLEHFSGNNHENIVN